MDFKELVHNRQSCRSFDPTRSVEPEKLEVILTAGRLAPSACNAQPYHITVVQGEQAQQAGACVRSMGMNGFTKDCPAFLIISERPYNRTAAVGAKLKDQDYRSVDIGILAAFLTLQASDLGLGSCILGWLEEKKLQTLLKTDSRIRLVLALGYPKAEDPLRVKKRKEPGELISHLR